MPSNLATRSEPALPELPPGAAARARPASTRRSSFLRPFHIQAIYLLRANIAQHHRRIVGSKPIPPIRREADAVEFGDSFALAVAQPHPGNSGVPIAAHETEVNVFLIVRPYGIVDADYMQVPPLAGPEIEDHQLLLREIGRASC